MIIVVVVVVYLVPETCYGCLRMHPQELHRYQESHNEGVFEVRRPQCLVLCKCVSVYTYVPIYVRM